VVMSSAGPNVTVTYVTDRRQGDRGDATVPFVSAQVPRHHGALRHEVVTGVDHGTAINNATALGAICRLINDARRHLVPF